MTPESMSRRNSDLGEEMDNQREKERERSRAGTLGPDEHAGFGTMSHLNRAPSRRTAAANKEDGVSNLIYVVICCVFFPPHPTYLTGFYRTTSPSL